DDDAGLVAGEPVSNLNGGGEIAPSVLIDELEVFAILVTSILESVADAVAAGLERRMFDDGSDRNKHLLGGAGGTHHAGKSKHGNSREHGAAFEPKARNGH